MAAAAGPAQLQQQDLFISRQGNYHPYRIPSLIVAKGGTLLAFCEARKNSASDTGKIDVLLRRSADGGQTWSAPQVVWDDDGNTCGNPCPVLDGNTGVVWLLLTQNPGDATEQQIRPKSAGGTRTVWLSQSHDDGMTWSKPANITAAVKDAAWGWYATGPGIGIQIQYGPHKDRLVIPCDHFYDVADATTNRRSIESASHVKIGRGSGRERV